MISESEAEISGYFDVRATPKLLDVASLYLREQVIVVLTACELRQPIQIASLSHRMLLPEDYRDIV